MADFSSTFYVNSVKSAIRRALINQKANSCPMAIRLAWHASGTFTASTGTGGSNGATMRFEPESADGANAGLNIERDILEPVKREFPEVSYADIWTLAGAVAIEFTGGPEIDHCLGRVDKPDGSCCPAVGLLPDASQGAEHLRAVFNRMGFNDRDIVALSGAHTLGRCHKTRSGFDGPWTADPLKFDNSYYTGLMNNEWTKRQWDGPEQFQDASGKLMMLPTDIAVKTDAAFKPIAQEFAVDQAAFFAAFKTAYEKLLSNGCPRAEAPASDAKDRASRDLREHSMHGSIEHAQAALAAGGDAGGVEANSGRTALHDAARFGHGKVIQALAAAGADKGVKNKAGQTASEAGVQNGKPAL
jgi:catalase (peroxidase I)